MDCRVRVSGYQEDPGSSQTLPSTSMWSEGHHGAPVKFKFVKRLGMLCLHMLFSAPLLLWLKEPPSSTHRSREPSFLAGKSESETMSDGYVAMYLSDPISIEETMRGFQLAWPESKVEWRVMSEGVHYSQQVARFYWKGRHDKVFKFETGTQWEDKRTRRPCFRAPSCVHS